MSTSTQVRENPGKRSRKTEPDHISNLPDCVISHILSRVRMKEAVRTSVLSRDWEFKWTVIQNIELDDSMPFNNEGRRAAFANFVVRILLVPENLQSLRLSCFQEYDISSMETWITYAMDRHVRDLYIYYRNENIELTHDLFDWNELRKLELVMPCTFMVPAKVCFTYLTTLRLEQVKIFNENFDADPVEFNFPALETLELSRCRWLNVKFVEIHAPQMIRFKSETPSVAEVDEYSIKIIGDRLVRFESCGYLPEEIVLSGRSKVVYATLKNNCVSNDPHLLERCGLHMQKLFKVLPDLKDLELSGFMAKAIVLSRLEVSLPEYYKLERLVLSYSCGDTKELLELLHATPFLKILDIELISWKYHHYNAEENVPSCIISHLEIIKFTCFAGKTGELLKLAKLFLKNAVQLKKLCFPVPYDSSSTVKNEIKKELSTYPKASPSSTIVLTY